MQGNFNPVTFNMMLNMMNVMHPNMGYNINNYNNNMYNNQVLMNMMMNWMNQNPFLQQIYNNMPNNNIGQNFNQNQNQTNQNVGSSSTNNSQAKYDPYPNTNNKINISFTTQKGKKMIIVVPRELQVKELLKMYVLRNGLGPKVLEDAIFFVYNGLKVKNNEERKVGEFFGFSGTNIVVLDIKDLIGA